MDGACLNMRKLDVKVKLYKNGVLVSGERARGDDSARLGKAIIGRMKLGKG